VSDALKVKQGLPSDISWALIDPAFIRFGFDLSSRTVDDFLAGKTPAGLGNYGHRGVLKVGN
jgi:hypothetical protein